MNTRKVYRAIGLMSGTSLDGIDAALIETDGQGYVALIDFEFMPYADELAMRLRACFGLREMNDEVASIAQEMTRAHVTLVRSLLQQNDGIDLIGFHGQTLTHDPSQNFTWQIGDGAMIASELGVETVANFRENDVSHGGQGAPLLPLYHAAIAKNKNMRNVLFLNIGGVSNITFIGENDDEMVAFDCGAGNALMDDYIMARMEQKFDKDGNVAAAGLVDKSFLSELLGHGFFTEKPPKSLDRNAWNIAQAYSLSTEDAMATLLEFTAQGVLKALDHLPRRPDVIFACGGGRKNITLMQRIANVCQVRVQPVENLGFDGDAIEAQGFAYLAVRSKLGLPITLPKTTGVPEPLTGGTLYAYSTP